MLRGVDEHQMKRRSFAFYLAYIKCFRTYSVYLSLRLPAQILYAVIHLPSQREARALPRRAQKSTASAVRSRTCGRQRLAASLYPPPAALESQTPQREARALPCRRTDSTVPAEFANSHYRYKNVTARRSHLNISPKGRNISHARSAYFTAPKARFHTAAKLPYFTASQAVLATQKSGAHRSTAFLQN